MAQQVEKKPPGETRSRSLSKAFHLLGLEKRSRWVALIVVALISSGFEILGAALVFVLLSLVSGETEGVALPFIGDLSSLVGATDDALLLIVVAAMAVFFVLRSAVHIAKVYMESRVVNNAAARLSTRLVKGYLELPYGFHLRRNSSDIIRNAYNAVDQLAGQIYMPIIAIAAEGILVLFMLIFLVMLAPEAALLAVVVLGVAAAILLRIVQPLLKRLGTVAHAMKQETLATLQQSLQGIRDVKLLGREGAFSRSYGRSRLRLARSNYVAATAYSLPVVTMELALLGVILGIFSLSILRGEASQEALPVLGLFAYAGLRLQPSLQRIIGGVNRMKFATAPLDEIYADIRLMDNGGTDQCESEALPLTDKLTLEAVSFRYEGAVSDAVTDVNLDIRPGEIIGICGATGGGKTTLVDLIVGLLVPTHGRILIDGIELNDAARSWQRSLGVVSQTVFLTDESFRQNIALGVSSENIDEHAVDEAVKLAQLEAFVGSLPEGLDTVVGERGVRVSGGQRQRIAIARALYRRPSVLIFDEGTSALDNTTERELIDALNRLRGTRTILMVAHRLSTVRDADRIIFVDEGRVSGTGTYSELSRSHPGFRRLAEN